MIKLFTSHAHVVAQDLVTRPWMEECGKYSSRIFTKYHLFNIIYFYLLACYFHLPLTYSPLGQYPFGTRYCIFLCSKAGAHPVSYSMSAAFVKVPYFIRLYQVIIPAKCFGPIVGPSSGRSLSRWSVKFGRNM